jgi:acetyl-CoA carboxylase biotin carboxyl carrier protein
LELKDIKELIALIRKNDLTEFSLEQEGFKITLKRGFEAQALPAGVPYGAPMLSAGPIQLQPPAPLPLHPGQPPQSAAASTASAPGAESFRDLPSPMVGTFYAAAAPDVPPFVSVGQQINPDTVICIIEAMKVMNEIKAEVSGTVVEVLAENGKPVQYGQPLFRLR